MDATEPPTSTARVAERVAAHLGTLSPAERRVAQVFAERPEETAFVPATEIARMAGTSDATVIRTARALGYAGLPALKRALFEEMRGSLTPAARLGYSLERIGPDPAAALDHTLDLQIAFLEAARRTVRREDFQRAVALLDSAERVLTLGIGTHAGLADFFTLRLRRIGHQALALSGTGFLLADTLLGMRGGDVLVVMVYGQLYREIEATLARAREANVAVVLLTDTLGAAIQPATALTAYCTRDGLHHSVAPTVVLLEALLLGVAVRDRPRALAAMRQLNDLRTALGGHQARSSVPLPEADGHRPNGVDAALAVPGSSASTPAPRRRGRRPGATGNRGATNRPGRDTHTARDGKE